eukprot:CAMPEP_0184499364 /NCGR_PEP_ID=MMETSP0113_2-20130426/41299_1 /TAXON_ID=91329 /ORGANISM="Norrisiella sphaerica, Strain BC52" /LENGTH=336 /DNA_ID=CAMNT_0026887247 /DNA_START=47 /DNA_END=1057 /DNA_ORIENTATION=-
MKSAEEIAKMSAPELRRELQKLETGSVAIGKGPRVPQPPPSIPTISPPPVGAQIEAIQKYIHSLQYNFIGKEYFKPDKRMPLQRVMYIAKNIIKDSLPIKCLEATMLAIYLTRDIEGLTRLPLRFGTTVQGHVYWHIVLAVCYKAKWGALGLSRRHDLASKPLEFASLASLANDYKKSYESIGHRILKITAGLPVGTSTSSTEKVYYHFLIIPVSKAKWSDVEALLNKFTKSMVKLARQLRDTGKYTKLENTVCCKCLELQHPGLLYKPPSSEGTGEDSQDAKAPSAAAGEGKKAAGASPNPSAHGDVQTPTASATSPTAQPTKGSRPPRRAHLAV